MINDSEQRLRDIIAGYGSMTVAFSGGVDSTLLAWIGKEVLGDNLQLIFINSPFFTAKEVSFVREWTSEHGINFEELTLDPLDVDDIAKNDVRRCYYCKNVAMGALQEHSRKCGIDIVADGLNQDDFGDYRPGIEASNELGLKHPFVEAEFTKAMIRELSRKHNLPNADRPAAACLASRIPYDTRIDKASLSMVELAEDFLEQHGFNGSRVRKLDLVAKLELRENDLQKALDLREIIITRFKEIGFKDIYLDLQPYRMGSLTPEELLKK